MNINDIVTKTIIAGYTDGDVEVTETYKIVEIKPLTANGVQWVVGELIASSDTRNPRPIGGRNTLHIAN